MYSHSLGSFRIIKTLQKQLRIISRVYDQGIITDQSIGLAVRVFASGQGDRSSIIQKSYKRVIQKTQKIVLEASLFNTQHHKI